MQTIDCCDSCDLLTPFLSHTAGHSPAPVDTHPTNHSNLTIPPDDRRILRPAQSASSSSVQALERKGGESGNPQGKEENALESGV